MYLDAVALVEPLERLADVLRGAAFPGRLDVDDVNGRSTVGELARYVEQAVVVRAKKSQKPLAIGFRPV